MVIWANSPARWGTYYLSSGAIGVYLLVFVSGGVLQYSYQHRDAWKSYGSFVLKRLERIYPAYWLTLLFCFAVGPGLILHGQELLWQISGFLPFLVYFAWWIGLFVALSVAFPLLSWGIKKGSWLTLLTVFVISIISRFIAANYNGHSFLGFDPPLLRVDRVFFACLLFEFTLGMFVVKKGLLLKSHSSEKLTYAANFSYYVFLTHVVVSNGFGDRGVHSLWHPSTFVFYITIVLLISYLIEQFDNRIQIAFRTLHKKLSWA